MKDEFTTKDIKGVRVLRIRTRTPRPKIIQDKTKYNRKRKD